MDLLLKNILIVNFISVILIALFAVGNIMYESYKANYYSQADVEAARQSGQLLSVPRGPIYALGNVLAFVFMFLLPVLIVAMSGIYQYNTPGIKGYAKSLLIPISYIVLAFFLTLLFGSLTGYLRGEKGMIFIFIWLQFAATFAAVAVVNLVVALVKRA